MPDNLVLERSHQRDMRVSVLSQRVNQVGLARAAKSQFDNVANRGVVSRAFGSDRAH
jgi:hypothetical protein